MVLAAVGDHPVAERDLGGGGAYRLVTPIENLELDDVHPGKSVIEDVVLVDGDDTEPPSGPQRIN